MIRILYPLSGLERVAEGSKEKKKSRSKRLAGEFSTLGYQQAPSQTPNHPPPLPQSRCSTGLQPQTPHVVTFPYLLPGSRWVADATSQVDVFQCSVDGDSLTCSCRYAAAEDTAKAKKGFHDLEVRAIAIASVVGVNRFSENLPMKTYYVQEKFRRLCCFSELTLSENLLLICTNKKFRRLFLQRAKVMRGGG